MKRIIVALIFVSIIVSACNFLNNASSNSTGVLRCNIDGKPWSSVTRVSVKKSGGFSINGSAMQQDALDITITGNTKGTYTLGTLQYGFVASYTPLVTSGDSLYTAINGTVVLSDVDLTNSKISGTFQFNLVNVKNNSRSKAVTDGVFTSLSYQ